MTPDKVVLIYTRQWKNQGYSPEAIGILKGDLQRKIRQEIFKKMVVKGTTVVTN